jgi:hypothetical protein
MVLAICKMKNKFGKQSLDAIKLVTKVWGKKEIYLGIEIGEERGSTRSQRRLPADEHPIDAPCLSSVVVHNLQKSVVVHAGPGCSCRDALADPGCGQRRGAAASCNLLIRLKRIYNFLYSMLVYAPFALCFVTLCGVFMHFP